MPQEFQQTNRTQQEQPQDAQETGVSAQAAAQSQEGFDALDAVLDDIESTLETNAEEYVNSFVQKGGE
ncbi:ubiquitin-like protein Pup [Bifidobacterium aesculapii]|uniref:ubiquitin-like protein Pup n=1 Tax=Bifidobacterium aesculapii TaxID=1329411 RepID=UPI0006E2DFE1|nr:ubiquitin-like protein Pup [Bifidobacterium aesculapii]